MGRGVVQLATAPAQMAGTALDLEGKAESAVLDPLWRALGFTAKPGPSGGDLLRKPAEAVESTYERLAPVTPARNWKEKAVDIGSEIAGPLALGGVVGGARRGLLALKKPAATGLEALVEQLPKPGMRSAPEVRYAPELLTGKPTVRVTPEGVKPATTLLRPLEQAHVRQVTEAVSPPAVRFRKAKELAGGVQEWLAPATKSPEAGGAAAIIRNRLGEQAHNRALESELFSGVERGFERAEVPARLDFIRKMEHGTPHGDAALDATAQGFRQALDAKWNEVVRLRPEAADEYRANYFPHIWADAEQAQKVYGLRRVGGPGFLKERTLPTVDVGLKAGLKLKDTNPARLVVQRLADMDRYLTGQRVIDDLKASGLARTLEAGAEIPSGWQRAPDRLPHATGLYMPSDVALIIDRWLAPGLAGNKVYDATRSIGNSLNQFQLGMSAYHLMFTTLDAMTSRMALGIKELATPGMRGRGLVDVVAGLSPHTPIQNYLQGRQIGKAYRGIPGYERFQGTVDAIVKAGGRASMDPFYRTGSLDTVRLDQSALGQFSRGMRETATKLKSLRGAPAAVKQAAETVSDLVSYPIMQKIVPAQKLGIFHKMAAYEIERLGPTAKEADVVRALQTAWDSVDNRMGQMVYDNLFWNKTFKDLSMAAVRSVGWNLGTGREVGGGSAEMIGAGGKLLRGQAPELTHKMSYVISLPIVTGFYGAIAQYLMTGEGPRELKDYFAPRTGKVFPDGRAERVQLASYMKDVLAATKGVGLSPMAPFKVAGNIGEMATHKIHPLFSSLVEMFENEDFYGAAIRDPRDPEGQQIVDTVRYAFEQVTPFGLRQLTGTGQMPPKPGFERSYPELPLIGITPAPAAIERTAEEQAKVQAKTDRMKLAKKKKRDTGGLNLRTIWDQLGSR